jgi:peroxiredoxin
MKWLNSIFGGRTMAALTAGTRAPQFELTAMDGSEFSLYDALSRGPVVAVFFKISCPVCQYALPYYERIFRAYGNQSVTIVGVSQNQKSETAEFMKRYGITFPVVLDNAKTFPTSNEYGLTNVPTTFWISEDGGIEVSSVGWVKREFEEIARKAATVTKTSAQPIFHSGEQVADFRAG